MSPNVMSDPTGTGQPSRLLVMGAPGSGKRTQSVTLAQRLEVPSLSTGDLFRAMMCYDSPVSARLRDTVGHGGYVDDDTTNAAIDRRLEAPECQSGFLLYGYPRTTSQAAHLDQLLAGQHASLDTVVCLEVDDDVLFDRLVGREKQLGRIDDQYETVRPRLALYHEKTEPLVDRYRDRGLLVTVDGTGTVRQVAQRIDAALAQRAPALTPARTGS
jgi:adenylate kinase